MSYNVWVFLVVRKPDWLNAAFIAAAAAGLLTQAVFSLVASRQSRSLNRNTKERLDALNRLISEVSTISLGIEKYVVEVRKSVVELAQRALVEPRDDSLAVLSSVATAHGVDPPPKPANGQEATLTTTELADRIDQLIHQSAAGLTVREAYSQMRGLAPLQDFLYALYSLRTDGRLLWNDASIGWDTRLHSAAVTGT